MLGGWYYQLFPAWSGDTEGAFALSADLACNLQVLLDDHPTWGRKTYLFETCGLLLATERRPTTPSIHLSGVFQVSMLTFVLTTTWPLKETDAPWLLQDFRKSVKKSSAKTVWKVRSLRCIYNRNSHRCATVVSRGNSFQLLAELWEVLLKPGRGTSEKQKHNLTSHPHTALVLSSTPAGFESSIVAKPANDPNPKRSSRNSDEHSPTMSYLLRCLEILCGNRGYYGY